MRHSREQRARHAARPALAGETSEIDSPPAARMLFVLPRAAPPARSASHCAGDEDYPSVLPGSARYVCVEVAAPAMRSSFARRL